MLFFFLQSFSFFLFFYSIISHLFLWQLLSWWGVTDSTRPVPVAFSGTCSETWSHCMCLNSTPPPAQSTVDHWTHIQCVTDRDSPHVEWVCMAGMMIKEDASGANRWGAACIWLKWMNWFNQTASIKHIQVVRRVKKVKIKKSGVLPVL